MKTLIAIGGGSFQKGQTSAFDAFAIARSGKTQPYVLCIPAASNDDQGYAKRCKQYFRSLGCESGSLRLYHTKKKKEEVKAVIENCDIIYLGAGDTRLLMEAFRTWDLIECIKQQYAKGTVIMGCSAGANVLFTKGYSDTTQGYQLVDGMGLHEGIFCPHAQRNERQHFTSICVQETLPLFACDDECAYVKVDDQELYLMK